MSIDCKHTWMIPVRAVVLPYLLRLQVSIAGAKLTNRISHVPREVVNQCQHAQNLWRGPAVRITSNDEFCLNDLPSTAAVSRQKHQIWSESRKFGLRVRRSVKVPSWAEKPREWQRVTSAQCTCFDFGNTKFESWVMYSTWVAFEPTTQRHVGRENL
jgi:hypothetical protein